MHDDVLCVIPARGGSQRIPHKNIQLVGGKPMVAWTIEAALKAGITPYVSTDDQSIGALAKSYGAQVIIRPLALSADTSPTEDVLIHALDYCKLHQPWVMCLPPTSPCRSAETITRVLQHERDEDVHCIMTVTEYRGDIWSRRGRMMERIQQGAPRRQQERVPMFEENSAVYLTRSQPLWMTRSIMGYGNVQGIDISREEGWDVNDALDLRIVDQLLMERVLREIRRPLG